MRMQGGGQGHVPTGMQLSALLTRPAQPASSSGFRLMAAPWASLPPRKSCPAQGLVAFSLTS